MVTQPISSPFPFRVFFFFVFRNTLAVLDVLEGRTHTISLPINLQTVFLVAEDKWLLVESKTHQWVDLHSTSWSVLSQPASCLSQPALSSCVCLLTISVFGSISIGETSKKRGRENLNKLNVTLQSNYKSVSEDDLEINSENIMIFTTDLYFFRIFPVSTLRIHCILAKLEILQNRFLVYPLFKGPQSPSKCCCFFVTSQNPPLRSFFFILSRVLLFGYVYVCVASSIGPNTS